MCQTSPVRFHVGSRSKALAGIESSELSNNSNRTRLAWRLKSAKLTPSASPWVPKGKGIPQRISVCAETSASRGFAAAPTSAFFESSVVTRGFIAARESTGLPEEAKLRRWRLSCEAYSLRVGAQQI